MSFCRAPPGYERAYPSRGRIVPRKEGIKIFFIFDLQYSQIWGKVYL